MENSTKYDDLVTQANYARFKGVSRARICQRVKNNTLTAIWAGGAKLIKLKTDELTAYKKFVSEQKVSAN